MQFGGFLGQPLPEDFVEPRLEFFFALGIPKRQKSVALQNEAAALGVVHLALQFGGARLRHQVLDLEATDDAGQPGVELLLEFVPGRHGAADGRMVRAVVFLQAFDAGLGVGQVLEQLLDVRIVDDGGDGVAELQWRELLQFRKPGLAAGGFDPGGGELRLELLQGLVGQLDHIGCGANKGHVEFFPEFFDLLLSRLHATLLLGHFFTEFVKAL